MNQWFLFVELLTLSCYCTGDYVYTEGLCMWEGSGEAGQEWEAGLLSCSNSTHCSLLPLAVHNCCGEAD